MVQEVEVFVGDLLKQCSGTTYKKRFGSDRTFTGRDCIWLQSTISSQSFKLRVVIDEGAKFLNMFGLFVDIDSGNIALGQFPNSDEYICIGNFYELLSHVLFENSTVPDFVDMRYLLERLKLDPQSFRDLVTREIVDMYRESLGSESVPKFHSVSLNIAQDDMRLRDSVARMADDIAPGLRSERVVSDIIGICIKAVQDIEILARDFYGVFIAENSLDEVKVGMRMSLDKLLESQLPNIEALTLKYLGYGIPMVFLMALKSYGLGIKQRKDIYDAYTKCSMSEIYQGCESNGELLSSMYYISSRSSSLVDRGSIISYNVIDLLRAVGWEDSLIFSLSVLIEYKNRTIYDSIVNRFQLRDILDEEGVSEKNFVAALNDYRLKALYQIDSGSVYTRRVTPFQSNLISFNSTQFDRIGSLFQNVSSMILKKF